MTKIPPFAHRISRLSASPIRETLHLLDNPRMISFAGGLPTEESFPSLTLDKVPVSALQYGPSEGDFDLRQQIAKHLREIGFQVSPKQVFVLSGSQQGIDLVSKLFVEEGTNVAVEAPTYLAALQVFRFFGANFSEYSIHHLPTLDDTSAPPRLLYVNPTFQNPTGYCYAAKEREQLANFCEKGGIVLFEDDPYRDLVYESCERRPIATYIKNSDWVYQSSFSKTFAPGLRVAYLVCSTSLISYFSRLKQATDLHTNRLSQYIIREQYFKRDISEHLSCLQQIYRIKRDRFEYYLTKHLGDLSSWARPKGGLFFWLKLSSDSAIDTRSLLAKAIEKNVAFMPGEPFFPAEPLAANQLRLNFSLATEQQADHGLAILRTCLQSHRCGYQQNTNNRKQRLGVR